MKNRLSYEQENWLRSARILKARYKMMNQSVYEVQYAAALGCIYGPMGLLNVSFIYEIVDMKNVLNIKNNTFQAGVKRNAVNEEIEVLMDYFYQLINKMESK